MNFIWSLRGPVRAVSCGTSRPARDDDHDPAPPALTRRTPALARRTPAPASGIRRPAAAPRVARQDLGARLGPLGLVQLVSVVRVHDGRLSSVRFRRVTQTTNGIPRHGHPPPALTKQAGPPTALPRPAPPRGVHARFPAPPRPVYAPR